MYLFLKHCIFYTSIIIINVELTVIVSYLNLTDDVSKRCYRNRVTTV